MRCTTGETNKIYTTGVTYMKFAVLLAVLSSTITFNTAYAAEATNDSNEIAAYCDEQAQLAGVENAAEKSRYVQECIDSFGAPSGGDQSSGGDQPSDGAQPSE
jgi:hypothetical protein